MDLVKLNNEISGMRPFARQSKVHVIHHLTKKAGELLRKKGPEDKKPVYLKKAEKCMQEALIDKVLQPDEIIKFSLQFDSSLRDKVLDDISMPLSAKAFARIAAHPSLVKKVNEFREKYPDWDKWLEKSLEKLGTGARFGNKMKNGRVKAHLRQRQRVEEAIDTIRRAQMSWLQKKSEKSSIKIQSEKIEESPEEEKISSNKKVEEDEAESNDGHAAEDGESEFESNADVHSESSNNSDAESTEDSSAKPGVDSESKSKKDSNKSKRPDKGNSKDSQKSRTVIYEEVDENESKSDQEIEEDSSDKKYTKSSQKSRTVLYEEVDENESESDREIEEDSSDKKYESAAVKKKLNQKLAQLKKEDSDSEENVSESADDSLSEKSLDDESENSAENESEGADDESKSNESGSDDRIDEKMAKKLLKKEKRKQKVIIPRSREVEVCKFSDLLKKEQTRSDEQDESNDSDNKGKPSKSPEKGVDPFFMTKNNDFLRIATARREAKPEELVPKGPKWGIEGSENWTGTRRERRARARMMMGVPDPEGFSRRRGQSTFDKFNAPSFPTQRKNAREAQPLPPVKGVPPVPDEPENLHPSWAAKRKMNIASVGFEGKKIKFDDSD